MMTVDEKIKALTKGVEFELHGNIFVVTDQVDNTGWIYYEYKDGRTPNDLEIMGFMPHSDHFMECVILTDAVKILRLRKELDEKVLELNELIKSEANKNNEFHTYEVKLIEV